MALSRCQENHVEEKQTHHVPPSGDGGGARREENDQRHEAKIQHGHLRAMVLGACDQVRKVNEDELRPEGREGVWGESILGRGNSMCKDPVTEEPGI